MNDMPVTYEEAVNYIYDLPRFTAKHSFEEGRRFLDRLGAPDSGLRVIHVAGTNGKGSVCIYMESILLHAGMRTGCFISPHLTDCRERIRICGRMCSKEAFTDAFMRVRALGEELFVPTFFEYLFFMAMLIFKDEAPDVVILETGLGGRLDATNLIRDKLAAVITSIGYDHCRYLGNTYEEIAREKAGICAAHRPLIYWDDINGADEISRIAGQRESVEIALSKSAISDIHRANSGIDFCLRYKYDRFICLNIGNNALYQIENASLAVMALANIPELESSLTEQDYICGVRDMFWPGRMEVIDRRIVLDGAHNEHAIRAFIKSVEADGALARMLIFGCMKDKDYETVIALLAGSGLFERVVTVSIDSGRAMSAEALAVYFARAGYDPLQTGSVSAVRDAAEAYEAAREYTHKEGYYAYITGSLYLAGEIRGYLNDRF